MYTILAKSTQIKYLAHGFTVTVYTTQFPPFCKYSILSVATLLLRKWKCLHELNFPSVIHIKPTCKQVKLYVSGIPGANGTSYLIARYPGEYNT